MASDVELLDAWAAGDRDAGDALIERHFEAVYRFFRSKLPGDVHDVVQDTFLRCTEARERFEGKSSFRAFLFGVARRVLQDHLRRVYRNREDAELSELSAAELGTSPSQLVARREEHRILLEALRRISLDHQIALELVYWESLTGAEIAEVLDLNPNTARGKIREARQALAAEVTALCTSQQLVDSTLDNLERWAVSVRDYLHNTS